MKSQLKRADMQDIDLLLPLVAAYHDFEHIDSDEAGRRAALLRLLGGRVAIKGGQFPVKRLK